MSNAFFEIERLDIISDLIKINYDCFEDNRGDIYSTYHTDIVNDVNIRFKHDKFATSRHGVLRGFHGDEKSWKLVNCIYGKVHQVFFDYRQDSTTYGKIFSFDMGRHDRFSLLVPPGVLNAYACLSEMCVYHYKYSYRGGYNDVANQITVKWNDPLIGYEWPIQPKLLSSRDK